MKIHALSCALFLLTASPIFAQDRDATPPLPGIRMVEENTLAVDYRKGSTSKLEFQGTDLLPQVTGEAKVISKRQLTDVHVDVENLRPAKSLDRAYLTYVLWSISPEGHAKNIGELVEHDGKASLHTTTDMQAFALIITAEPDFAVAEPSEMVVAQNILRPDTKGRVESVNIRYRALPRSVYVSQVTPVENPVYGEDPNAPLDLLQARNAVRIARDAQAEKYSADVFQHAQKLLDQAEDYYRRKQGDKPISTVAREAAQTAEEARVNSIRAEEQAKVEQERQENEERAARARTEAAEAQQQAQQAQEQAREAQQQAEEAARQRAAAEQQQQQAAQQAAQAQQQAQAEADQRRQLEQQQQASAQAAEQAQQQAEQAQQQAQAESQQRAAAEQQAEQARQQAAQARQHSQELETQQAQMRQQLLNQLNQVLQTRDSAKGLIVSMPDVLFDTSSANLKGPARERLAKVAGILQAYPDIQVEIDGYTDSTGSEQFNQQLSEQRASSVQAYLVQQGVPSSSIAVHGFGESDPIASNDSAQGRQQNRRVELVVSGQSIGNAQGR
jgi:outer membrane protein OmpA-like peptidoglycan-associated protein